MDIMVLADQVQEFKAQGISVITLNGAARKYGIPEPTLFRWAKRGIIKVLRPSPGNRVPTLIDEKSVEEAVRLYKTDPGRGKRTVKPPEPVGLPS